MVALEQFGAAYAAQYLAPHKVGDHHYQNLVFPKGFAMTDAVVLSRELDSESLGWCEKANQIRFYLARPFWREPERIANLLSGLRRIDCGCHEIGSFAVRVIKF